MMKSHLAAEDFSTDLLVIKRRIIYRIIVKQLLVSSSLFLILLAVFKNTEIAVEEEGKLLQSKFLITAIKFFSGIKYFNHI